MKRLWFLVFAVFLVLPMATAAFAAGGPPKDMLKGVFTVGSQIR